MKIKVRPKNYFNVMEVNTLWTNVPFTHKPGSWFLPAKMFERHLQKSDILSKYAGERPVRTN